jgi:transposase-like protein
MAKRSLRVDHVNDLALDPAIRTRTRTALSPGTSADESILADETYVRVPGEFTYLYRAVDSEGNTIDFLLSSNRDAQAAKCFFQKALRSQVIHGRGSST